MKSIHIFPSTTDGNHKTELHDLCYNCNFKSPGASLDHNKKDCVLLCGFNRMLLKSGTGSEERGTGVWDMKILVNIQHGGWTGGNRVNTQSKVTFTLSLTKYDWIEDPRLPFVVCCILDRFVFLCYIAYRRCRSTIF